MKFSGCFCRGGLVFLISRLGSSEHYIRAPRAHRKVSEKFDICTGVRQGDILTPVLFNLFFDAVIAVHDVGTAKSWPSGEKGLFSLVWEMNLLGVLGEPIGIHSFNSPCEQPREVQLKQDDVPVAVVERTLSISEGAPGLHS